jgi:hypothetical protein
MSEQTKTVALRLLSIGLVAPLCVHLLAALLWAPILIFTSIVSYPLMVAVTLLLLLPVHLLFRRFKLTKALQLVFVTSVGLGFGFIVYLILFAPFPPGRLSASLATDYALLGLLSSTLCWFLYHWGPLRVRVAA